MFYDCEMFKELKHVQKGRKCKIEYDGDKEICKKNNVQ